MAPRVWVVSGLMLAALVAGYVTLVTLTGDDSPASGDPAPGSEAVTAGPSTAAGGTTGAATTPALTEEGRPATDVTVVGAVIGADGVARMEMPLVATDPTDPGAAFQAEIDAYAARIAATLPQADGWDTFEAIAVEGRMIIHEHRIDMSLRAYTLPITPRLEVVPHLEGWLCDGSTCFEFDQAYADGVCGGDMRALLDRGAVAVFRYRDREGLPIGTMTVTVGDCRF